jgi:uncharacterized phage-associated protein
MYDERAVANFLLDEAEKLNAQLTHLALQKLLFFSHAWHLAEFDAPLVRGLFQAWQFGPVLRAVYDSFRSAGKRPIKIRAKKLDLTTGHYVVCKEVLDERARNLLTSVLSAGANLPAWYLSELTHMQGAPWDRVWSRACHEVNVGMKIPNTLIRGYFLTADSRLPRS